MAASQNEPGSKSPSVEAFSSSNATQENSRSSRVIPINMAVHTVCDQIIIMSPSLEEHRGILSQISPAPDGRSIITDEEAFTGLDNDAIVSIQSNIDKINKNNVHFSKREEVQIFKSLIESVINELNQMDCHNVDCAGHKYLNDLTVESEWCSDLMIDFDFIPCPPLQRIYHFLKVHNIFINESTLWETRSFLTILEELGIEHYDHQQLLGDFLHIHSVHCHDERVHVLTCESMKSTIRCSGNCVSFKRHHRERNHSQERTLYFQHSDAKRTEKTMEIINDREQIFQEQCDRIHSYFLHRWTRNMEISGMQRVHRRGVIRFNRSRFDRDLSVNRGISSHYSPVPMTSSYPGEQEDSQWIKHWDQKIKESNWNRNELLSHKDEIHCDLLEDMGIFRWQSAQYVLCSLYGISRDNTTMTI